MEGGWDRGAAGSTGAGHMATAAILRSDRLTEKKMKRRIADQE